MCQSVKFLVIFGSALYIAVNDCQVRGHMPTGDFHSSPDYRLSQYPGGDLYTHPHPGEYNLDQYLRKGAPSSP